MADDLERKLLGDRLRLAREYVGLSQEQVAVQLGVVRTAVTAFESGHRKVDAIELKKLAKLYGKSVAELSGEVDDSATASTFVDHLARSAQGLSKDSQDELLNFAKYLETRSKREDDA